MESFTTLTGKAAALPAANIDTDIIFPARFLLITTKQGLGRYAFYEWRYAEDGTERPEFVLNQPAFRDVQVLVVGNNFGSGSSREQAPWAIRDLGVRCLISTRFGEIFEANCARNGILPVTLGQTELVQLQAAAEAGKSFTVDLQSQTVTVPGQGPITFAIDPGRREALLNGWDEIALMVRRDGDAIAAFEHRQRAARPWLFPGD